ncbi:hypothetical protein FHS29_001366 [Saccharothrix tamanrassetensis]|uniref:Uncharacterized protein n=1 Tax=Saccharothrix tamanrassetensis TaxID=1051531 RepID=A0A841CGG0_9PSEU|nr:hypothetical protein [Saccharothrix tamanrassetensis]MBB5954796.1 hypothetical protein [Saccharothrix tamanrassetensis]
MNDLDDRRPSPQPQQQEEERVERDRMEVPKQLSGLEWLVRQAQRQRSVRRPG